MRKGKLFLLPNLLGEESLPETVFPPFVGKVVSEIEGLIAESEKEGRRYLRRFLSREKAHCLPLALLNEHTPSSALNSLLLPIERGEAWGVVPDAGIPCIADPGADLVFRAREKEIEVEALVGPCSLLLALQLSGFPSQRFSFRGYLPREERELIETVCELEKRCRGEVQLWIETPYRTGKMFELLKRVLHKKTLLCVACSITLPAQRVLSFPVEKWLSYPFAVKKEPALFLIYLDGD